MIAGRPRLCGEVHESVNIVSNGKMIVGAV